MSYSPGPGVAPLFSWNRDAVLRPNIFRISAWSKKAKKAYSSRFINVCRCRTGSNTFLSLPTVPIPKQSCSADLCWSDLFPSFSVAVLSNSKKRNGPVDFSTNKNFRYATAAFLSGRWGKSCFSPGMVKSWPWNWLSSSSPEINSPAPLSRQPDLWAHFSLRHLLHQAQIFHFC